MEKAALHYERITIWESMENTDDLLSLARKERCLQSIQRIAGILTYFDKEKHESTYPYVRKRCGMLFLAILTKYAYLN